MRAIIELAARVAELERRFAGMVRHGTVAEVDPSAGRVRVKLGQATGGGDLLSPWVPYSQLAGALKAHTPPAVGQQFSILSPSGDWRQAVALPLTWSEGNPSPSGAGDENVVTYGDAKLTLKADSLTVQIGGVSLEISADGVAITGGKVTHNGKNIGSTHIHGGVATGPAKTAPPAN